MNSENRREEMACGLLLMTIKSFSLFAVIFVHLTVLQLTAIVGSSLLHDLSLAATLIPICAPELLR